MLLLFLTISFVFLPPATSFSAYFIVGFMFCVQIIFGWFSCFMNARVQISWGLYFQVVKKKKKVLPSPGNLLKNLVVKMVTMRNNMIIAIIIVCYKDSDGLVSRNIWSPIATILTKFPGCSAVYPRMRSFGSRIELRTVSPRRLLSMLKFVPGLILPIVLLSV